MGLFGIFAMLMLGLGLDTFSDGSDDGETPAEPDDTGPGITQIGT